MIGEGGYMCDKPSRLDAHIGTRIMFRMRFIIMQHACCLCDVCYTRMFNDLLSW
jgi:hypothetical protein